ncbi:hypothetical protein Poly59_57860 [Rubripirellula reticaptiva]|uniref:Uncharacterized protein n=1 Tax=Rubripirellula reticaptiva TaxID=2528013 RepID=A0A5C6EAQ3_9BACT|nr:hypothetical protein Poly59_57860 [Rubripirellula reticaptiva]
MPITVMVGTSHGDVRHKSLGNTLKGVGLLVRFLRLTHSHQRPRVRGNASIDDCVSKEMRAIYSGNDDFDSSTSRRAFSLYLNRAFAIYQ